MLKQFIKREKYGLPWVIQENCDFQNVKVCFSNVKLSLLGLCNNRGFGGTFFKSVFLLKVLHYCGLLLLRKIMPR